METWQKRLIYGMVGAAMVIIFFLVAVSMAAPYLVKETCTLEAGKELTVDKVVSNPVIRIFSSVCQQPDTYKTGETNAVVRVGVQKVKMQVIIEDKIAPKVTLRDLSILQGNKCKINEFVVSIEDATETHMEYLREPSFTEAGIQKVIIKITDSSGNETDAETNLIIVGK